MPYSSEILTKSSLYVTELLATRLPAWAVYHNIDHTVETVQAAEEIGGASKLSRADMEVLLLAAWFHDTGYIEAYEGHEEVGAGIAREFLERHGYAADKITYVVHCILATRMPQRPSDLVEQVICDADMVHVGKKRFVRKSNLLRLEIERRTGKFLGEREWAETGLTFISQHSFHTPYAKSVFGKRRIRNLSQLQEKLQKLSARLGDEFKPGAHSFRYRVLQEYSTRLLSLIASTETGAHLMIVANTIILAVAVLLLLGFRIADGRSLIPGVIQLAVSLTSIIFAVLAVKAGIGGKTVGRRDDKETRISVLSAGVLHDATPEEFERGVEQVFNDPGSLQSTMIMECHDLGRVLARKRRCLEVCHAVFLYGSVASVVTFAIAVLG